jgi:DNA-binding PadR family transcriptional regulator
MNLNGALPTLILQSLSTGPNHGYRIAKLIQSRSKGVLDFKEATLYPALHDLENKGLLESYERIENGRTRRYYRLTEAGRKQCAEVREWKRLSGAISHTADVA